MQKYFASIALLAFVLTPNFVFATSVLYISETGTDLGITCDDAGDNIASLDAIYLMQDASDINTPTTGYDSPNVMSDGCPGIVITHGENGPIDPRQGLIDNGYAHMPLRLKIDPTVGTTQFYEYFYITECSEDVIWTLDDECPGGEGGGEEIPPINWGSATTTNRMLGSLNFGVTILITLGIIGFCGYLWNTFVTKRKKPWQRKEKCEL